MKILLAIDESAHSLAAVSWVANAQWPAGSAVRLLSSVRSDLYVTGELYAPGASELADLVQQETARSEKILREQGGALAARGLAVDTRVTQGDPRLCIVDEAKAWGADLVVVGSHGRTGLSKLFLGSVATHVVAQAPCNVLVVKLPRG